MNVDKRRYVGVGKGLSVYICVHLSLIIFLCCFSIASYALSQISISAERIEHAELDVKNLALQLNFRASELQLHSEAVLKPKAQTEWIQLSLSCQAQPTDIQTSAIQCPKFLLESSRVKLPLLVVFHQQAGGAPQIDINLQLDKGSFSDETGLHAAENLTGNLSLHLQRSGAGWQWQGDVNWQKGGVFWQPFYIANGGHRLRASGKFEDNLLSFNQAQLHIKDVGELTANGEWDIQKTQFQSLLASLPVLNLQTAYPMLFKPLLQKTALADAELSGLVSVKLEIKNAEPHSFALGLKDVSIKDNRHKFAFYGLNAEIPWDYDVAQQVRLAYASGALLNLPLGATEIRATLDRYALTSSEMRLPILDGALKLKNVSAAYRDSQWFWHLAATLEPISMQGFSAALAIAPLSGKASAEIPLVTYAAGSLVTDGSLELNVFNGKASVSNLTMQTPLGLAPKLNADIALRNLDLGELTNTYSFGAIEGRLDGDIKALELQNWKPVKFDAKLQNSPGNYPKKISQRAVENISALGGGGAAAAMQRSFLRFFKQFNYGKMGLSCRLRNDICEMGGVESTPHGYIIVKGSGIPAITVMGYNQTVGWSELLSRIKRVTEGNAKAVIN